MSAQHLRRARPVELADDPFVVGDDELAVDAAQRSSVVGERVEQGRAGVVRTTDAYCSGMIIVSTSVVVRSRGRAAADRHRRVLDAIENAS